MISRIGRYHILERIGRDGPGAVFKAHDPVLDRAVALKVITADLDLAAGQRERLFREAQVCASLSHPNIVTVYELGEEDGRLFMATEFLEGESLRRLIARRHAMLLEQKLAVIAQVCAGLQYAHQHGVVHRDISPGNIFLLGNGHVKILDFGIARMASGGSATTGTGTGRRGIRYMAPEYIGGHGDHRVDIFSVGAVSYELLAYRPAFGGEDPLSILERVRSEDPPPLRQLDPALPEDVCALVEQALRKEPERRFASVGAMAAQLAAARRRLLDETEQIRDRVRARLEQIRGLEETLAARLGQPVGDETVVMPGGQPSLAAMKAVDAECAIRIERLQAQLDRAAPAGPHTVRPEPPERAEARETPPDATRLAAAPGTVPPAPVLDAGEPTLLLHVPPPPGRQDEADRTRMAPLPPPPATTGRPSPPEGAPRPSPPLRLVRRRLGWRRLAVGALAGAALLVALAVSAWQWREASRRQQAEVVAAQRLAQEARNAATLAAAAELAKASFDAADAKDQQARRLDLEAKRAAARRSYLEAAADFSRAAEQAKQAAADRSSAVEAKAAMLEARRAAPPRSDGPLLAAARDAEREADAAFARLAFAQARQGYRDAAERYARAAPKRPPADVAGLLERYASAFERKDVELIRQVRCAISESELQRHAMVFANVTSYRLVLKIEAIVDEGDELLARGRREDIVVLPTGQTLRTPAASTFTFRRQDDRWCIGRVG